MLVVQHFHLLGLELVCCVSQSVLQCIFLCLCYTVKYCVCVLLQKTTLLVGPNYISKCVTVSDKKQMFLGHNYAKPFL